MKKFIATLLLLCATAPVMAQQNPTLSETKKRTPRIDREINSNKFVFKGESMIGLTASYGTINSEDSDLALIIDNINLKGSMFSIQPHYGYFYRDNHAVGVRLGYSYANGTLDNLGLNLGEAADISISVGNMGYTNNAYSVALYHRSYMALDRKGRFGLFAEWELSGQMGRSQFDTQSEEVVKSSISKNYRMRLGFAPGLSVYIFPNVCASVSFGLGGLQYNHIKQYDGEGSFIGKRDYSKLRFGLNLTQINIGVNVHIWSKKNK